MWQRHTQPLAFSGHELAQRRRLRVVDEAHVPAVGQLARVDLVVAAPRRPLLLVEVLRRALQRVVHQLGRVEELFAAVDHVPLAVQADVAHQRHERVEDLRDAAAEGGGRDVHHALALQRLGQLADFGDQLAPADVRVVGERLVARRRRAAARGGTIPNRVAPSSWRARPRRLRRRVRGRPRARGADAADYGLWACSTGASTARPSCLSCSRSPSPPSRSARGRGRSARRSRRTPSKARRAFAELQSLARRISRAAARQQRRRTRSPRTSPAALRGARRHRRRRLLGAHATTSKRQTIEGERHAHHRGRVASRLDQRHADRDRRPPRRGRARRARRSCRARRRCWSWRACSPRARPSARSCSPPPAAAAAATRVPPTALRALGGRRPRLGGERSTRRSCSATSPARRMRTPLVVPFSDGLGSAPLQLQRTVADAITQEAGARPGRPERARPARAPGVPADASANRACSNAGGVPAVLVQVSGERGPSPRGRRQRGTPGRLRARGAERGRRARHGPRPRAGDADGPRAAAQDDAGVGAAAARADAAAAAARSPPSTGSRARAAGGWPVGRWALWTLSCALPFFSCAVFAYVLGWLGVARRRAVRRRCCRSALPFGGARRHRGCGASLLTFALAWLLWAGLMRRLGWGARPDPDVAGLSLVLVLIAGGGAGVGRRPAHRAAAAARAAPVAGCWPSPELRPPLAPPRRVRARRCSACCRCSRLIVFYAHQLGLGRGRGGVDGRAAARRRARRARRRDPVEPRARLRGRGRARRPAAAARRRRRPLEADGDRGHDPRPALLRRSGLAWRYGVGSATMRGQCRDADLPTAAPGAALGPPRGSPVRRASRVRCACSPC